MRVLLQRVTSGSVSVDHKIVGSIDYGLVLFVGIGKSDTEAEANRLADKIVHLRIFRDEDGKFNRSLLDVDGDVLVISQFTLYADASKGRRPNFTQAARPEQASPLCNYFTNRLEILGIRTVETGIFGASMEVTLCNQGPVTIWLDSDEIG